MTATSDVTTCNRMDGRIRASLSTASVLVVLVLYEVTPSACQTLVTLCDSLRRIGFSLPWKLFIYDNSAIGSRVPDHLGVEYSYVHDASNGGLSAAYNAALELAIRERAGWLLLLDQDTEITTEYLAVTARALNEVSVDARVGAIVPKIKSAGKLVSPARVLWGGVLAPVAPAFSGSAGFELTAVNSASLIRVSVIEHIGGFDSTFWLDYLDHWIFARLHRAGLRVYVTDIVVQHRLSIMEPENVPADRYQNILQAETRFYRVCKSPLEQAFYVLRLATRLAKFLFTRRSKLRRVTMRHLLGILVIRSGR